jgi:hypothetical protein
MSDPRISVIIVSDYVTCDSGWDDQFRMMHALQAQDIGEPFEVIIAERVQRQRDFPAKLLDIGPGTRAVFLPKTTSSELKNAGLESARGEFVAVFEADAPPRPDWLRLLAATLRLHPEAGAISGRTIYGDDSAFKRAAGLLDRGYIERKGIGAVSYVCNNGALYRREFLEAHPYSSEKNPFVAGRQQSARMANSGKTLFFQPAAIAVHEFGGFPFFYDVRLNQGFSEGRWAYLQRGGKIAKWHRPLLQLYLALIKIKCDFLISFKTAPGFIHWYDWPLVIGLIFLSRVIEWRGTTIGLSGKENLPATSYR